jgi:hypothetical protein
MRRDAREPYAATSPVFTVTLPEENVFDPFVKPNLPGVPAGEYKNASADGLWVSLPPLPPGNHQVHFEMKSPNVTSRRTTPTT